MKIAIIVGHSASGKSTVLDQLCEHYGFEKLVTTTTREMRPGETNGVDYHFIQKEDFKKKIEEGFFLEHVEIKNNFYGTGLNAFEKDFEQTTPAIILDPIGAKVAQEILSNNGHEVKTVFIDESPETCIERVISRDADPKEKEKRINDIKTVEAGWKNYMDYDFRTTPNATIEENCKNILNFVNPQTIKQKPDGNRFRNRKKI